MLRAISTKFLGPTMVVNGSRVKAVARKRERDMPALDFTDNWDHASGVEDNHARVAKLLATKLGWDGLYVGGSTDEGFCFVNIGRVDAALIDPMVRRGVENRDWFIARDQREA